MAGSPLRALLWAVNGPVLDAKSIGYEATRDIARDLLRVKSPFRSIEDFLDWHGIGVHNMIRKLAGTGERIDGHQDGYVADGQRHAHQRGRVVAQWELDRARMYYEARMLLGDSQPARGVVEALRELRKEYMLGVVTNLPLLWVETQLKSTGLWDLFDTVLMYKPKSLQKKRKQLAHAVHVLGVEPHEVGYITDRVQHAIAARLAGMNDVVIAGYGWLTSSSLIRDAARARSANGARRRLMSRVPKIADLIAESPYEIYAHFKGRGINGPRNSYRDRTCGSEGSGAS